MKESDPISSSPLNAQDDDGAKEELVETSICGGQPTPAAFHPLRRLRRYTPARIALGRTGLSLPTHELIQFGIAHAMARDAVHAPFDVASVMRQLTDARLTVIQVSSAAADRPTYLRRPDLGRQLDEISRQRLTALKSAWAPAIVFIIADGLSALAPQRYAVEIIEAARLLLAGWKLGPVIVAKQARVALGDEIGHILQAEMVGTRIGERPGLSSPDSLGIYLTYAPRVGRTDAERNCISNVRTEGVSPTQAAHILCHLIVNARRLKLSGVGLKDESQDSNVNVSGSKELVSLDANHINSIGPQ